MVALLRLGVIERAGVTLSVDDGLERLTLAPGEVGVTRVRVTWRREVEEPGVVGGAGRVLARRNQTSEDDSFMSNIVKILFLRRSRDTPLYHFQDGTHESLRDNHDHLIIAIIMMPQSMGLG